MLGLEKIFKGVALKGIKIFYVGVVEVLHSKMSAAKFWVKKCYNISHTFPRWIIIIINQWHINRSCLLSFIFQMFF